RRTPTQPSASMRISPILATLTFVCSNAAAQSPATLIVNARVIDGTGAPARAAEVRIVNGRIDAIGHWTHNPNDHVVDAHGLTLAPGFVDPHTHHEQELL